jgi:F0F1-type ATP synthase assembly protein I
LAGWWIGSWLDKQLGTQFVMILLILLGLVAGLWNAIDMVAKLNSGSSNSTGPSDPSPTSSPSTSPDSDSPEG